MVATTCDWLAALPFSEVWCIDFEYYPGRGLANGGVDGDPVTPLCLVAHEVRSGRTIRLWQDELGHFPPYRLDNSALIISYGLAAEFSCHLRLGWGEPACAIDALVEFRHSHQRRHAIAIAAWSVHSTSSGSTASTLAHKKSMRDRILQGPPFTEQEKRDTLDYCDDDDVKALVRLLPRLLPTIRSWPHALHRGRVQWAIAKIEHRGLPFDLPLLTRLRRHWDGMRTRHGYSARSVRRVRDRRRCSALARRTVRGVRHTLQAGVAATCQRKAMHRRRNLSRNVYALPDGKPIAGIAVLAVQIEAQFAGGGRGCTQSHAVVGLSAPRPHAVRHQPQSTPSARPNGCVSASCHRLGLR